MNEVIYKAEIFNTGRGEEIEEVKKLISSISPENVLDGYLNLQRELIKINNPKQILSPEKITTIQEDLNRDKDLKMAGCWVYFPWRDKLIHLVDKENFIKLRTSRNLYKITEKENEILSTKKVGIIGLSVGHSVAMNLAMERSATELRLADFDELELTNLNRIRSNILNLGMPKVIMAAREIAELDPFIEVKCFTEGITEENIEEFLTVGGNLDLLVEECDSLDIKILARNKARKLKIPVLMETSDRGMIDVERFDLENDRPILHGMIEHLDLDSLKDLKTSEEKIPFLMPMVGLETMSPRLKASALEVGNTIGTWPQIASSVMLGGAILADTYRRIMLNQFNESGRFIVDPNDILKGKTSSEKISDKYFRTRGSLSKDEMLNQVRGLDLKEMEGLPNDFVREVVKAAGLAPSGGNAQPWKFLCTKGRLFLFLDKSSSDSYMDYRHSASYIAIGSAIENAVVKAASLGFQTILSMFPIEGNKQLIGIFEFRKDEKSKIEMAGQIDLRYTERRILEKNKIPEEVISELNEICRDFSDLEIDFIDSEEEINTLAEVISTGDWLRVMNPSSHNDFVNEEMRWTREQLEKQRDGIHIEELSLSQGDLAGLHLVKDINVISFMNENNHGHGLKHISAKIINSAPLMMTVFADSFDEGIFVKSGLLLERLWLACTARNIGFQILNVPIAFLLRLKNNDIDELSDVFKQELLEMSEKMERIKPDYMKKVDLFFLRFIVADRKKPLSLRKEVDQILEFGE